MPTENEEWIEASRTFAAENERRYVRLQDAANEKIIELETTIGGLNLELIEEKERAEGLQGTIDRLKFRSILEAKP